jgi:hypothetical protein
MLSTNYTIEMIQEKYQADTIVLKTYTWGKIYI